eukprot:3976792-Heterocapsa_arctica.AAC.1
MGPRGFEPTSMEALHLFLIRFVYGPLRRYWRDSLYVDVCQFAADNNMTPWPEKPGQGRTRTANGKTRWINANWPGAQSLDHNYVP